MNDEMRDRLGEGEEPRERDGALEQEGRDAAPEEATPEAERPLPGSLSPRPLHEDEAPFTD